VVVVLGCCGSSACWQLVQSCMLGCCNRSACYSDMAIVHAGQYCMLGYNNNSTCLAIVVLHSGLLRL
jgi:hypothetical protein